MKEGCDLRDELAELNALLDRLRLKRYDIKRKINQFYSPIVRQLPPDVMSTIFEFCLPDFADTQILPSLKPFSPLYLGAICSYWRDIAWSTPSLWSSLVVCDPSDCDSHLVTGIAREWLARSGRLPLSIYILSTFDNKTVSALIDVINHYSPRWSELDLLMPSKYYERFHASDNHEAIHAPTLKSIRFRCEALTIVKKLNFRLTCPRLERASLSYFPLPGSNIQWDNLTHLTQHSMTLIDSFIILRKTPRLVFCQASGFISLRRVGEQNISPLVLTSLRSLHLLINSLAIEEFLNNLTVPHLEEFSLLRKYSTTSIEVITSFLRRSACSLCSLSMIFETFPYYFEGFMNILQSMPSLTTLSIQSVTSFKITSPGEYDPRNILELVVKVLSSQSTSRQQGFLPNLRILEYTGELFLHSGNYNDLYPLTPADNGVRCPLHLLKLELYPADRIPENMISYVSSLAERGITVNVSSDSKDILRSSIDYYRSRKESLCRDWSDDLDLTLFS